MWNTFHGNQSKSCEVQKGIVWGHAVSIILFGPRLPVKFLDNPFSSVPHWWTDCLTAQSTGTLCKHGSKEHGPEVHEEKGEMWCVQRKAVIKSAVITRCSMWPVSNQQWGSHCEHHFNLHIQKSLEKWHRLQKWLLHNSTAYSNTCLTFDQLPGVQSAGQGMCVLQEDSASGLGMCWHSLDCRAFCSSTLTAWMQSTVLFIWPELPQLAEHFCHSPTHHLPQRHTVIHS